MKVTPVPVENAQRWLMVEKGLRPMLADLDLEPTDIEHALETAKRVHEKWNLHLEFAFNPKGRKERFVVDVVNASEAYYRIAIVALLYEVAVREVRLHHCTCGKAAHTGEDVLRV